MVVEHGRTGREQRRSGVSSVQSGCQADCHVSHWDWLLWASGCFGVYIKRTGCEHENTTHFSTRLSNLLPLLHYFFFSCSQAFFSSSSHERYFQGAAESLSSGGETACLQGCHDRVHERPGREKGGIEVEKRGGQRSERHMPNYCVIRDDRGNVSTTFSTEQTTHEKLLPGSQNTRKVPSAAIYTLLQLSLFCTSVRAVSITSCSLSLQSITTAWCSCVRLLVDFVCRLCRAFFFYCLVQRQWCSWPASNFHPFAPQCKNYIVNDPNSKQRDPSLIA